jgi:gluconolactonase
MKRQLRVGANLAALLMLVGCAGATCPTDASELTSPGAQVAMLADGFRFTEGPACDPQGNVYFSDIPNNRVHFWDVEKKELTTFMENSGGMNGLYWGADGWLYGCQGGERRLVRVRPETKELEVLADRFEGKKLNAVNDLWIDPKGGIYITDPGYGLRSEQMEQGGEFVYYVTPDRQKILRVSEAMQRPNGIVGTKEGKKLYVTEHGGNATWVYDVAEDCTLTNKQKFCDVGSDGMTMDACGNLYLTPRGRAVAVHAPDGSKFAELPMPRGPANVVFAGKDRKTLFITAREGLYSLEMQVKGQ